MISNFASPGDEYLRRLGELAYAVSSLEWTLLGDLHRLSPVLPPELTVSDLAGQTTGRIARQLADATQHVSDVAVADYMRIGAAALEELAPLRNAVLHARPATIDGEQRLYRWRAKPAEAFAISDAWLDDVLRRAAELSRGVSDKRPSFADYP